MTSLQVRRANSRGCTGCTPLALALHLTLSGVAAVSGVALLTGVAMVTGVTSSAHAVLIRQSLAGSVGASFPMTPNSFTDLWNPGYGLSGSIRLRLVPRIHLDLGVGYYRHLSNNAAFKELIGQTTPNVTLSGYDLWVIPVSLVGEFDLLERGSTKPYLLVGAGIYSFGTTHAALSGLGSDQVVLPDPSETAFGIQAGFGVRTPVALGVTLFLDASYHVGFTEANSTAFLPVRLGLQF